MMRMMDGGRVLALMRFWIAIRPPKVVLVSAHAAISMAALGAEALAHSASRMASASLGAMTPGVAQLLAGCAGGAGGGTCLKEAAGEAAGPQVWREAFQSEALKTFRFATRTMVRPWPSRS